MDTKRSFWPGWETVRMIGRGSFGAVYEIHRDVFGEEEKAALKVISIPQNDSDIREMVANGYDEESITNTFNGYLKNIVAEYSLMRKMNGSSNVVNCDDFRYVQHDDGYGWDIYIKMELLTPLTEVLPAKIPEEQVIRIAKDMCAALELCSKHNIIHRDIKPQNIFVSDNGDYKLGDFGIAKVVEKTMGATVTGTYRYMAPEVNNNRPYNSTADIYSLGLVLYWMLNERRMPFMPLPPVKLSAGMDEEARYRRFSGEQIPAPKNGSEALKAIVLKACAFDPRDRYQSAREMREALQRLSGGMGPDDDDDPYKTVVGTSEKSDDPYKTVVGASEKSDDPYKTVLGAPEKSDDPYKTILGAPKKPVKPAEPVAPVKREQKPEPKKKSIMPIAAVTVYLLIVLVLVFFVLVKHDIIPLSPENTSGQTVGAETSTTLPPVTESPVETETQAVTEAVAEHKHDWIAATCTAPQTCSTCAETVGLAAGHVWTGGTCQQAEFCSVCAAVGSVLDHLWSTEGTGEISLCDWCGELSVPAGFSVEQEVQNVRNIFNYIKELKGSDNLAKTTMSNGGYIFTEASGQVRSIVVFAGTDGIGAYSQSYRREYYFENGELVFAFYEGKDAHRLYFYGGRLFRWRYTAGGTSTNYDLEFGQTYRMWEQYALEECKALYPNYG